MVIKMAGPARYHSFLPSFKNSLEKSRTPLIGGMSPVPAVKTAVLTAGSDSGTNRWFWGFRFCSWSSSSNRGEMSGCLALFSIAGTQRLTLSDYAFYLSIILTSTYLNYAYLTLYSVTQLGGSAKVVISTLQDSRGLKITFPKNMTYIKAAA